MSCNQASLWLRYFQRRFTLTPDHTNLVSTWSTLVTALGITGLKSHDARFVAAMQCHGINQLLTFNSNDFKVFSIPVVDPVTV